MPINRFPVKLILRTNRLIGFIECADRGIIVDTKFMPHLDWIWERQTRVPVLLASSVVVLCNRRGGLVDEARIPSGFLYLFPIMLAAGFVPAGRLFSWVWHAHC